MVISAAWLPIDGKDKNRPAISSPCFYGNAAADVECSALTFWLLEIPLQTAAQFSFFSPPRNEEKRGRYNHLVFCLSFPAFAPTMIPFRHTHDKEVFERKREQKKRTENYLSILRIQAVAPPSGGEDRQKKRDPHFTFLRMTRVKIRHPILQIPLSCSLISAYLYSTFLFFSPPSFSGLISFSCLSLNFFPSFRSAQQINK